jgi:hypothetical protein
LNLALAAITLIGVPALLGVPLSFLMYLIPDLGYTLAISGVVALAWGGTQAVLTLLLPIWRPAVAPAGAGTPIEALPPLGNG